MSLTPEIIKNLDDQVMEIAGHLGMEWDQEYADRQEQSWNYHAEIKSGNKRISFSTLDFKPESALKNNGRFVIRGVFPRDKRGQILRDYNVKNPEITVAMDRGPEKIAHAIQSRLLPQYEIPLAIALEKIEKSNAYHAGRLQTLKAITDYLGQPAPITGDESIHPDQGMGIYKIEASSEGVKFEVTCGVNEAIKIFDILKR